MPIEYQEKKKDKRLLVLLALGALFMLPHLHFKNDHSQFAEHYCWIRVEGSGEKIYRFPGSFSPQQFESWAQKTTQKPLDETLLQRCLDSGVAELSINGDEPITRFYPSPRLALFLGRPFLINQADAEELTMLPGIGPHLAQRIVAYRNLHGDFKNGKMLLNVKGIGPHILSKLKSLISFHSSHVNNY